jgi:hypothetical protein
MILSGIKLWQLDIMPYLEEDDLDFMDIMTETDGSLYNEEFYYEVDF